MGAINRKTTGNAGSLFVSRTGFITWVNIENIWGEDFLENGNKNRWNLPCAELLLSLLCTRSLRKNSLLHHFYIACRNICSGMINLLFDGLAYNTSGHFTHCSYFSSPLRGSENTTWLAKYPHVLYAKPSNKVDLFYYKKLLFCNWLLFFGKSIRKHPDSVCENDVNNGQNLGAYYTCMPNHWMRG